MLSATLLVISIKAALDQKIRISEAHLMTIAWQMYRARPRRHTYFHHICHTKYNHPNVSKAKP